MQDPHICIEADPLSKMHGVPSHPRDRILPAYPHHAVCPLEEVKSIRFVSWNITVFQPAVLLENGIMRSTSVKAFVIDYTLKQTLEASSFKTMFVPFPFVSLFINLILIYKQ